MKSIGMLGLAVVATVTVLGLLGAGPASAATTTQLCKEATSPLACPAGKVYAAGTVLKGTVTGANSTFTTNKGNVVCTASEVEGETLATTGVPTLPIEITKLTFNTCKVGATTCTKVEAFRLPYEGLIEFTAFDNGTLEVLNGGGGEPLVKVDCSPTLACTFTAEPTLGITGGPTALIEAIAEPLNISGGALCPKTATWTAAYELTTPASLYVEE